LAGKQPEREWLSILSAPRPIAQSWPGFMTVQRHQPGFNEQLAGPADGPRLSLPGFPQLAGILRLRLPLGAGSRHPTLPAGSNTV